MQKRWSFLASIEMNLAVGLWVACDSWRVEESFSCTYRFNAPGNSSPVSEMSVHLKVLTSLKGPLIVTFLINLLLN